MTVRLEASIKRYIGDSTDKKPTPGMTIGGVELKVSDLPAGSSFLEANTGRIFRWTGAEWTAGPLRPEINLLEEILTELQKINIRVGIGTDTEDLEGETAWPLSS